MSSDFEETTPTSSAEQTGGFIGKMIALSIVFAIVSIYGGFMFDVLQWGWHVGRSIIN